MTITTDRIRRVAEKHVELQAICPIVYHWDNSHPSDCDNCAGTGWTPLPLSLWADALWKAGCRVTIERYFAQYRESKYEPIVDHPEVKATVGGRLLGCTESATADNADDALVMALEQAGGGEK